MTSATEIFARPGPRWFSIPAGRPFLDDMVKGLMEALGDRLSEAQLFTPTRRGARAMARAFSARARGGALLLPQIRAIGDLDEGEPPFNLEALDLDLKPPLSPLRRRFELARLIAAHDDLFPGGMSTRRALDLADSLGSFFDSLALEEIDARGRLDGLIDGAGDDQYRLDAMAEHWQISAQFLKVAVHEWPERLDTLGAMDPNARQVALIRRLVDQWTEHPPATPHILAGSTGSAPSTAALMNVVAGLPQGAVILPGLDLSLAADAWAQIEDSHPQGTMKHLLDSHHVNRDDVAEWPASQDASRKARARRRLLNEALRPAEATKDWRDQIAALRSEGEGFDPIKEGLEGLSRIQVARDEEAAAVIALLMREVLDDPAKVVALVTPDQVLARRVSARLTRWGLQADSSAGETLLNSLPGRFLLDLLGLMERPHDPVRLLGLLNNPLCRFNDHPGLRAFEMKALRGATPTSPDAIAAAVADHADALRLWSDYFALVVPLTQLGGSLSAAVTAIAEAAQALALDNALWAGAPGAQAAELLAGLIRESVGFTVGKTGEIADILGQTLRQAKVRTGGNTHPRLLILGAIEARLVAADRLILAGLEEGVWPPTPPLDPFLSRPMRSSLGLPSPERRTGLSAHDFVQAASAPEVFLIDRRRREGDPAVASRWLWRLQTLCEGAGVKIPTDNRYAAWAKALDRGLSDRPAALKPAPRPAPVPPLAVRPNRLSVTDVETFIRDPYAIYAKRILRLRPLDRPNEPVEARQRGTAIHKALERFVTENVPLTDETRLAAMLEAELEAAGMPPPQLALQRPLLPNMAREYIVFDQGRRADRPRLHVEQKGELMLTTSRGDFVLVAKADRIELRDGTADVVDFKTGYPPSAKAVVAGFFPQLTLTAAMLRRGAFEGVAARATGELVYVRVAPGESKPSKIRAEGQTADDLADTALARLHSRLEAFAKPAKPYISWAAPQYARNRGGDYDQLARLYEWDVLGDDEPAAAETGDAS